MLFEVENLEIRVSVLSLPDVFLSDWKQTEHA